MADIFISYSQKEPEPTKALARDLEARGFTTWWDTELKPGDRFSAKIQQELESAKAVIVIWSNASVMSEWVGEEAALAKKLGKLITVCTPDLDLSKVPMPFGSLHIEPVTNRTKIFAVLAERGIKPSIAKPKTEEKATGDEALSDYALLRRSFAELRRDISATEEPLFSVSKTEEPQFSVSNPDGHAASSRASLPKAGQRPSFAAYRPENYAPPFADPYAPPPFADPYAPPPPPSDAKAVHDRFFADDTEPSRGDAPPSNRYESYPPPQKPSTSAPDDDLDADFFADDDEFEDFFIEEKKTGWRKILIGLLVAAIAGTIAGFTYRYAFGNAETLIEKDQSRQSEPSFFEPPTVLSDKTGGIDNDSTSKDSKTTFFVQVGAGKDLAEAMVRGATFQQKYAQLLGGYSFSLNKASLDDKSVWYRQRFGPVPNWDTAVKLCTNLKAAGLSGCLPVKE